MRTWCVLSIGLALLFGVATAAPTDVTTAPSAPTTAMAVTPELALHQTLVAISPAALVTHSAAVAYPAAYADTGTAVASITGKMEVIVAKDGDAAARGLTTLKFPLAGACTLATSLTANIDVGRTGVASAAQPIVLGAALLTPRIGPAIAT